MLVLYFTYRQVDVGGVDGIGQDDTESHQPRPGRHDEGRDPGAGRVLQEAEAVEGHQQVGQHGHVHRDILQHTKTSLFYNHPAGRRVELLLSENQGDLELTS